MDLALAALQPWETFNLITFAGETRLLFPEPVPANPENLAKARGFLRQTRGGGGTEMMKAIRAALQGAGSTRHVRIVCFVTDGYVGNEEEIIAEVKRHSSARVFSFGIGNSVNRYLLDKMAEAGRGEVEYVGLSDDGSAAAQRFHERVRNPILTDIKIEWNGLPVSDVLPARVPDLFSAKPLVVAGRYSAPAKGSIRVRGYVRGAPWFRDIPVDLPAAESRHDVLPAVWARRKVDALCCDSAAKDDITKLGMTYGLLTPFTSFVAVEETVITDGGAPRRIQVPVEMPEGVQHEGIFGEQTPVTQMAMTTIGFANRLALPASEAVRRGAPAPVKVATALKGRTGPQRVQIWLTDLSPSTIAALKKAGFELTVELRASNAVIGRISAEKIERLAQLTQVKWIAPAP